MQLFCIGIFGISTQNPKSSLLLWRRKIDRIEQTKEQAKREKRIETGDISGNKRLRGRFPAATTTTYQTTSALRHALVSSSPSFWAAAPVEDEVL